MTLAELEAADEVFGVSGGAGNVLGIGSFMGSHLDDCRSPFSANPFFSRVCRHEQKAVHALYTPFHKISAAGLVENAATPGQRV